MAAPGEDRSAASVHTDSTDLHTCGDSASAATASARDPFADDVLERLIRSNQDYQREHGHYIVPLAERLLAARAECARLWRYLMGDDGTGHCRGCGHPLDRINTDCAVCYTALCAFMDEDEEPDDA